MAAWLNGSESPRSERSITLADLLQRIEKLELERPAFILELQSLLESAQEILGRAESKRAQVAARESKAKKRDEHVEPVELSREDIKAQVRLALRAQGKLQ